MEDWGEGSRAWTREREPSVCAAGLATTGPSVTDATAWLRERRLLPELQGELPLSDEVILRRYLALSKCAFGEALPDAAR